MGSILSSLNSFLVVLRVLNYELSDFVYRLDLLHKDLEAKKLEVKKRVAGVMDTLYRTNQDAVSRNSSLSRDILGIMSSLGIKISSSCSEPFGDLEIKTATDILNRSIRMRGFEIDDLNSPSKAFSTITLAIEKYEKNRLLLEQDLCTLEQKNTDHGDKMFLKLFGAIIKKTNDLNLIVKSIDTKKKLLSIAEQFISKACTEKLLLEKNLEKLVSYNSFKKQNAKDFNGTMQLKKVQLETEHEIELGILVSIEHILFMERGKASVEKEIDLQAIKIAEYLIGVILGKEEHYECPLSFENGSPVILVAKREIEITPFLSILDFLNFGSLGIKYCENIEPCVSRISYNGLHTLAPTLLKESPNTRAPIRGFIGLDTGTDLLNNRLELSLLFQGHQTSLTMHFLLLFSILKKLEYINDTPGIMWNVKKYILHYLCSEKISEDNFSSLDHFVMFLFLSSVKDDGVEIVNERVFQDIKQFIHENQYLEIFLPKIKESILEGMMERFRPI
jgi:hypothetical protein